MVEGHTIATSCTIYFYPLPENIFNIFHDVSFFGSERVFILNKTSIEVFTDNGAFFCAIEHKVDPNKNGFNSLGTELR